MRRVSVAQRFAGTVHEAESCWYDTSAWQLWIDGLDRVVSVDSTWPEVGARVQWVSGPAGRGEVTERVTHYEALVGQTVEVLDDSITGRQTVAFTPVDDEVEVEFTLEYEIRKRSVFTPVIDFLFIRRPMETSLRTTLGAFGVELESRRATAR